MKTVVLNNDNIDEFLSLCSDSDERINVVVADEFEQKNCDKLRRFFHIFSNVESLKIGKGISIFRNSILGKIRNLKVLEFSENLKIIKETALVDKIERLVFHSKELHIYESSFDGTDIHELSLGKDCELVLDGRVFLDNCSFFKSSKEDYYLNGQLVALRVTDKKVTLPQEIVKFNGCSLIYDENDLTTKNVEGVGGLKLRFVKPSFQFYFGSNIKLINLKGINRYFKELIIDVLYRNRRKIKFFNIIDVLGESDSIKMTYLDFSEIQNKNSLLPEQMENYGRGRNY